MAGLGAILYDASGKPFSQFSKLLSASQIVQVQSVDGKTPIFELEVLVLVLAIVLWKETIARSHVVWYLDNNGAVTPPSKATVTLILHRCLLKCC